jgi:hypothetical protein
MITGSRGFGGFGFVSGEEIVKQEHMLKWFAWEHLPTHLQLISEPFGDLARSIVDKIEPGPERTVALRKLLEAKDAAVRAHVHPGG